MYSENKHTPFYIEKIDGTAYNVTLKINPNYYNIATTHPSDQLNSLYYSTDNINWEKLNIDNTFSINLDSKGSIIYFKANIEKYDTSYNSSYCLFNLTNNSSTAHEHVRYGGNIQSIFPKYMSDGKLNAYSRELKKLFGNTAIKDASMIYLPDDGVYYNLFNGCENLTIPPSLKTIKNISRYTFENMFYGCKSLTTTPEFNEYISYTPSSNYSNGSSYTSEYSYSNGGACFTNMFFRCTSLTRITNIPKVIPTTRFCAELYKYMFTGCTSLEHVDDFSIIISGSSTCSNMFTGCTSLKKIPCVTIEDIINVDGSFDTSSSHYPRCNYTFNSMYRNCTSLVDLSDCEIVKDWNKVKPIQFGDGHNFSYMFEGCSNLTIPPKMSDIEYVTNYDFVQMFENTKIEYGPDLSNVKNTKNYAFSSMFYNLKTLKYPPILGDVEITTDAFSSMFFGCTSLLECLDMSRVRIEKGYSVNELFNSMYKGCTSLKSATIGNENLLCKGINNTFENCSSLKNIYIYFKDFSGNSSSTWTGLALDLNTGSISSYTGNSYLLGDNTFNGVPNTSDVTCYLFCKRWALSRHLNTDCKGQNPINSGVAGSEWNYVITSLN